MAACTSSYFGRGRVNVGVVRAASHTLFLEGLFCTHRNLLKQVNIQEFQHKLVEFDYYAPATFNLLRDTCLATKTLAQLGI